MSRKDKPAKPMGRIMRAASKAVLGKDMGAETGPTDAELRALLKEGGK